MGLNSQIQFRFVERQGDGSNRFQIDRETGEVVSTASFIGQAGLSFRLMVAATDRNGEGLTTTKMLLVSSFTD